MKVYYIFVGYFLLVRRNLETNKLGDEFAEIDIDIVATKPLLIYGMYDVKKSFRSRVINCCYFIVVILNLFKLNL